MAAALRTAACSEPGTGTGAWLGSGEEVVVVVDSVRPPQPRPTPAGRTGPRPGWLRRVHPRTSEREFLAFLDRYGDLLRGCAYLMVGEPDRAERLASTVLARRYGAAADPTAALVAALRELVAPQPAYFDPPWASGDRVELRDAGASPPVPPLVAELQQLTVEQRAAVVLGAYAGLSAPQVAQALHRNVATVEGWGHQAFARLAAVRPERRRPGQVASELRSAVTEHGGLVAVPAAVALGHGRRLVRRRRSRRATALVAAGVLVVAGGISVVDRSEVPSAATAPPDPASPSATADPHPGTVVASCDVKVPSCQATVMRDWRSRIAEVAADHVDPDRTYFTGYTFSYDPRYETTSFWAGRGGALTARP